MNDGKDFQTVFANFHLSMMNDRPTDGGTEPLIEVRWRPSNYGEAKSAAFQMARKLVGKLRMGEDALAFLANYNDMKIKIKTFFRGFLTLFRRY